MSALVLKDRKGRTIGTTEVPAHRLRVVETFDGLRVVAPDIKIVTSDSGKGPFTLALSGIPIPAPDFPDALAKGAIVTVCGIKVDLL